MKKSVLLIFVAIILLVGCAAPGTSINAPANGASSTKSTTVAVVPTISAAETATPTAEPTPLPTAIPVPSYFNLQNFSQFTGVQNYFLTITKHFKKGDSDILLNYMDYSADGTKIAISGCLVNCTPTLGGSYFLIVLDAQQKLPIQDIKIDPESNIFDVKLTPDGKSLIYSIRGKEMIVDLKSGNSRVLWTLDNQDKNAFFDVSPDGKLLAVATDNQLAILDLANGNPVIKIQGTFWGFNSPFFNGNGNRLAIYTKEVDRFAIVYDTTDWKEITRIPVPGKGKFALSSDGSLGAVINSNESVIKLMDLAAGTERSVTIVPYKDVASMLFSPKDDLLLVFGAPPDSVDFYEGVQVIDVKAGQIVGSLTQNSNPGRIQFSADGTSFLRYSYSPTDLELWALPTDEILKAETLLRDYFDAISKADYQKAASLTQLDSYTVDEVVKLGLDPKNLPAVFTALCKVDAVPCLPLGRIVRVMADNGEVWNYYALVTLKNPDGTEVLFDGISPYGMMMITKIADGTLKITSLHPGMLYPYAN